MRAPVIGLFHAGRPEALIEAARLSASITHAHPLGIEGAVLVASATALALRGCRPLEIMSGAAGNCAIADFTARLEIAARWLSTGEEPTRAEVVKRLGNGIAARESCVTALYVSMRFLERPFLEMQAFIATLGGDVDTLGAMAGAVWGAAKGAAGLPEGALAKLERRAELAALAGALHARSG